MGRFDTFREFPAVAPGFAPAANSNAKHADLFALGDDLGFSLPSQLLWVLVRYFSRSCSSEQIKSIRGKCNFAGDDHRNRTIWERLAGVRAAVTAILISRLRKTRGSGLPSRSSDYKAAL